MAQSSISQLTPPDDAGRLSGCLDPAWRHRLGSELRRRRVEHRMTQEALGRPLTKAFVSAVEHGRAVPSLPALRLMVLRLDCTLAEFFASVDEDPASTPS